MIKKNNLRSLHLTNRGRFIAFAGACLFLSANSALLASTNLNWSAGATFKETYDDNVYLQNVEPDPGNVATAAADGLTAAKAYKSSWLTTISPHLGLDYENSDSTFIFQGTYSPAIALYQSAEDEDYITHSTTLNFRGHIKDATWELLNSPTFVEGSTTAPTFASPVAAVAGQVPAGSAQVPAIGGVPLLLRREAFYLNDTFRLTLPFGKWFLRPVVQSRYNDFLTDQRQEPANNAYVYQNYIDRRDINGGLDVGYNVGRKTFLVVGYRFGRQDQFKLLGKDSPYDSYYHRFLIGVEGSPAPWIKLVLLGGPEIHDWTTATGSDFNRSQIFYWVDAKITLLPTKHDTIVLYHHSFEQPAFCGESVYEDITSTATWTHRFNDHFSASAGMELYIADWPNSIQRDDWIYTPSFKATYAYNKHLSAEFSFSRDWAENYQSGVAYGNNREYTRDLFSLAVQWVF